MPMQVSPILRALDDVEMRTQADHARVDPSPGEPFGAGILLPRPPWADDALPPPPRPAGGGWQDEGEPTAAEPSPAPAGDPVSRPPPRAVEGGHERFRPPSGEPPPLSEAVFDAAAKIAAEASATAEALENLKRLLEHKLPTLELVTPPGRFEHAQERFAAPPPAPAHPVRITAGLPPIMALSAAAPPLPMPLASEQGSGTALYVRGFLAGLGLALVTGIVLYLFISIG